MRTGGFNTLGSHIVRHPLFRKREGNNLLVPWRTGRVFRIDSGLYALTPEYRPFSFSKEKVLNECEANELNPQRGIKLLHSPTIQSLKFSEAIPTAAGLRA